MDTPGAVPRVSQYRLAAHLGAALVLYAGMLSTGLQVRREWKWANGGSWSGLKEWKWAEVLTDRRVLRFRAGAASLLGLVFLTAISGPFTPL
jgi:cytochrome c oxidase assembly protein subunit 15